MPKGIPKSGKRQTKPHAGHFVSGDARANNNGQRKREVVATASQARDLYVTVLHEPINTAPNAEMSNLEMIVRQHVQAAKKGDSAAREMMLDRIWGKTMQPITGKDGGSIEHNHSGTITFEQALELSPDELARRQRDALSAVAETRSRW